MWTSETTTSLSIAILISLKLYKFMLTRLNLVMVQKLSINTNPLLLQTFKDYIFFKSVFGQRP